MSSCDLSNARFDTKMIHAGHVVDPVNRSMAMPIHQTATFAFDTVEQMDKAWDDLGYLYTREGNPTVIALEKRLAAMEGGESCVVTGSGMGAVATTLLSLCRKGDNIVASKGLFFHSDILLKELFEKMDITVDFVDFKNIDEVKGEIKDNTSILLFETPENPALSVVDIAEMSKLSKENNCILIVDSTFAPPPISFPLSLGADIVIHSLTKYINGHGDALGGAVIGSKKHMDIIKYPGMPCFTGAALSPFNAWLILRGMETLEMRVTKHCSSAMEVASYLESNPHVEKVIYPALESHPDNGICKRQMNNMGGGIVSFWLKDGINGLSVREADYMLCNKTKLFSIATSLGEAHSLIQVENDDMLRLAIGLENHEDIINDLKQAFSIFD
ncbi:methionine-gamma-lyase [Dethiosulfatibacter aminovorans DSM 17477]|uniref:homocysteine desulfhydrase n=1 Tax=Dethiosulfatibacter aminovorans DSM 17477 TaxID=1121476 RepID=A0A1M6BIQ9_9FIRM|nr:PLP-dependent aspartate aminotransferase family protein [Dethiosulfatibacter aminovorans]SHI48537.1 methionine-gamma-lyase [Dethiosulfatibacter aminovorans DSM 17477]